MKLWALVAALVICILLVIVAYLGVLNFVHTLTAASTTTVLENSTITEISTETITTTVYSSQFNASRNINEACQYLVSHYNASIGLVSETPSGSRYYLYSDSFLAMLVLQTACNDRSVAQAIGRTLDRDNSSRYPNQFMVLDSSSWNFNTSNDYNLFGSVWTTINNGIDKLLPTDYADVAFLQSYYSAKWAHNPSEADKLFRMGAGMYNGTGFTDKAFWLGNSKEIFQTYKLALYIYVGKILDEQPPLNPLSELLRMQAPNGGFYSGYGTNFTNDDTFTNTETTCLAVLALENSV